MTDSIDKNIIEAISTPLPSEGKRLSYDFTVSMLFSKMYVTYVMPVPHVMSVTSITYGILHKRCGTKI